MHKRRPFQKIFIKEDYNDGLMTVNWWQWEVVGEGLPAEVVVEEKGE